MKLISTLLFIGLPVAVSGHPPAPAKPLSYEESQANNRAPTPEAGTAIGNWAAAVAKYRVIIISAGETDPATIRHVVVANAKREEGQIRAALKAAGWSEEQIETTIGGLTDSFLKLRDIADQVALYKQ